MDRKKRKIEADKKKLTDLNDDCLTSIIRFLDTKDIFQLFKVDERFHIAIKHVLPCHRIRFSDIQCDDVEFFFEIFGDKIENLDIDVCEKANLNLEDIENVIQYYCSNVKNCRISSFIMRKEFIVRNRRFFSSLKALLLDNVVIKKMDCYKLLQFISELDELVVCGEFPLSANELLQYTAHYKIKVLGLQEVYIDTNQLRNVPIPKNIEMLTIRTQQYFTPILPLFQNLKKLVLHRDCLWGSLSPILNLHNLKDLTLWFYACDEDKMELFFSELGKTMKLELLSVGIIELENNRIVHDICKITTLKELQLDAATPFDTYVLKFACRLKELRKIRFYDFNMFIRQTLFNEQLLLQFITFAKKLRTIELSISNVNGISYEQVYERLSRIIYNKRVNYLHINIIDKFNPPFVKQNKWFKMTVRQN